MKGGVPYRKHQRVTPAAQRSAAYALKCMPLLHISGAQKDHVPSVCVSCAREIDFVSMAVSTGVLQYSAH
jgi:diaminopimelate decarboxylase